MKKFNVMIVTVWFAIFFCSLLDTSDVYMGDTDKQFGGVRWVMARTVLEFNETVWTNCHWCGIPNEPVRVSIGTLPSNQLEYITQDEYANLADNRLTMTILRNTMPLLIFFVAALNVAFYAGNGTFGRWGRKISARWKLASQPIRERLALRRRQKLGVQLRGDPPLPTNNAELESAS